MWLRISLNCKRGFTLIEVLISIALLSLIMLMVWQTTSQSISAKRRMEKREELYHYSRVAVDKLTQDISQAFLLKGNPHLGVKQGSPQLKTVFKGGSDDLHFASLSHLRLFKGSRESEGCEIAYRLETDPDNRDYKMLQRRESKVIDGNPEEGGSWVTVANRLKEFHADYYDGEQFDWKSSWDSESSEKEKLPRAVRLKLTFERPGRPDEELPFTTIVMVGMYKNAIEF